MRSHGQKLYSITDLGTLTPPEGYSSASYATGLNKSGHVVGSSVHKKKVGATTYYWIRGFVWRSGQLTDMGLLPGALANGRSYAAAINDLGQVAGTASDSLNRMVPVLWQDGAFTEIGLPPWASSATLSDINEAGQLCGEAGGRAFLYSGGQFLEIPGMDEVPVADSAAYGINEAGHVAGHMMTVSDDTYGAFLFDGVETRSIAATVQRGAYDINDLGQIVGCVRTSLFAYTFKAFLWQGGALTYLSSPDGLLDPAAYAINNKGTIVGYAGFAARWKKGKLADLNKKIPAGSGWILREASDINEKGQIVGWGVHNGQTRAFLLTPAP
jgi:probable HAF family extracellular repeat protein